jgi:predicted GNAT family N-acyltransferase
MRSESEREAISRAALPQSVPPPGNASVPAAGDWSAAMESGTGSAAGNSDRPSVARELRNQARTSQRELGKVAIAIRLPGGEWREVRLWDFSSIGFGIVLVPRAGEPAPVKPGEEAALRVRVEAQQEFEVWCQVKNVKAWKGKFKIGLRRMDLNFPRAVNIERRESFRLPLAPSLSLHARTAHPFIYGHWCRMEVSDLNQRMGFSFVSRDESILVFEGMELRIHFELASCRHLAMRARVAWINASRANEVRFGVACVDMDFRLHNGICAYLFCSRQWTPARLSDAGFRPRHVKSHLRFRSVRSMEDYAEVLKLRREAYVGAGKRGEETRPEDMASPLDGKSRILMAIHHTRLVGTLTFTFPVDEDTILDSQTGFPGAKYPVPVPPKANLIEVSRLCIDSEYRGTDVLQGLFEHGLKHFLLSDRHWLLTSAMDELLPMYGRIGFRRLGASYKHPRLNHKEHHLIIASRTTFLAGLGLNILVWNSIFGKLVRYLMDHELLRLTFWERALIRAKLAFQPLAGHLLSRSAKLAFQKHLDSLQLLQMKAPADESVPANVIPEAAANGATEASFEAAFPPA